MTPDPLPSEIPHLPVQARMHLIDEKQFRLTEAQTAELDRRLAAHVVDPDRGSPWTEVKKRLMGR